MSGLRRNVDTVLACLALIGLMVTLVWPDWIEELTGLNPDGGSGAAEWVAVAVLGVLTLVFGVRAWRVLRAAAPSPS
jgi:hypothetical protein